MLLIPVNHKIFLGIAPVDFRRGIDGLAALCRQQWQLNPEDGHYFVFRNRRGNALKVLAYDTQGYWLAHKRLSSGRFQHWPRAGQAVVTLAPAQLQALLANSPLVTGSTAAPWRLT